MHDRVLVVVLSVCVSVCLSHCDFRDTDNLPLIYVGTYSEQRFKTFYLVTFKFGLFLKKSKAISSACTLFVTL